MTPAPKWLDAVIKNKPLTVSASACDTFVNLCKRYWWLGKIRKLKSQGKDHFTFGSVLHEVCERWLKADNLGRDLKTNKPVNLYPEGWETPEAKFGERVNSVSAIEASLIKSLITKALEEGILTKHPGIEVEKEFKFVPVMHVEHNDIITAVQVTGFIDVSAPGVIEDHKTSGSTRWLKSSRELAENLQLLFYAYIDQVFGKDTKDIPEEFLFAHNQFIKDPKKPSVRKTDVKVPVLKVTHFWHSVIRTAFKDMVKIRHKARCVFDISEPLNPKACQAYGGCEFAEICDGKITERQFEERYLKSLEAEQQQKQKPQLKKESTMSIFDKVNKTQKGNHVPQAETETETKVEPTEAKATPAAAKTSTKKKGGVFGGMGKKSSAPEKPKTEVKTEKPPAAKDVKAPEGNQTGVAPWHNDTCTACAKNKIKGFNSKGTPCSICDVRNKKAGLVQSTEFTISTDGAGRITWEPDTEAALEAMGGEADGGAAITEEVAVKETQAEDVESAKEAVTNIVDLPRLGYCEECHEISYDTPAGPCCINDHGGARVLESLPIKGTVETAEERLPIDAQIEQMKDEVSSSEEIEKELGLAPGTVPHREPETKPVVEPKATTKGTKGTKAKGRKKTEQVMLFINCRPVKGMTYIDGLTLFSEICEEVAEAANVSHYMELDAFKRRDGLAANMADIVEDRLLGKRIVADFVGTTGEDYNLFIRNLVPLVDIVIQ